jgi:hypothetical protein
MNSFNHYSLGSVGKWLYSGAGGIGIDEEHPGFKHFFLDPQFSTRFTSYKATFNSPYGLISSAWHIDNGHVDLRRDRSPQHDRNADAARQRQRSESHRRAGNRRRRPRPRIVRIHATVLK